jgi:hypothetical protein
LKLGLQIQLTLARSLLVAAQSTLLTMNRLTALLV